MMDFEDKSVVITGSGAGIGKHTAKEMAARGGLLTINDSDTRKAVEAAREIEDAGGKSYCVSSGCEGLRTGQELDKQGLR